MIILSELPQVSPPVYLELEKWIGLGLGFSQYWGWLRVGERVSKKTPPWFG